MFCLLSLSPKKIKINSIVFSDKRSQNGKKIKIRKTIDKICFIQILKVQILDGSSEETEDTSLLTGISSRGRVRKPNPRLLD